MSQKSFLDNKKITKDFPYVGGGGGWGKPTYGKFHMFHRFFLNESFPNPEINFSICGFRPRVDYFMFLGLIPEINFSICGFRPRVDYFMFLGLNPEINFSNFLFVGSDPELTIWCFWV